MRLTAGPGRTEIWWAEPSATTPATVVTQQGQRTDLPIPMGTQFDYNGKNPLSTMTIVVEGKNNVGTVLPI
jgi:hypothetical protein